MKLVKRNKYCIILLLLLILIFCVYVLSYKPIKENMNVTEVRVLSYENDESNEHKKDLENKLIYYGYNHVFLGAGEKWEGFGTKIKAYQEYIKNINLHDEDILVIIDSRDVYVNRPSKELIGAFREFYEKHGGDLDKNLKLVFSSETACCTTGVTDKEKDKMKSVALERDPNLKKDIDSYYLNTGLCIGYVKAFKKHYLNIDMDLDDDDQTKITNYWLNGHLDDIILDYNHELFSNAHIWGNEDNLHGCNYSKENNRFVLSNSNISPFFIQTPAKYWKCYDYLYNIE